MGPVLKVLLLQDVIRPQKSVESYQKPSTVTDISVNLTSTDLDGRTGFCFVLAGAILWISVYLYSLLQKLTVIKNKISLGPIDVNQGLSLTF